MTGYSKTCTQNRMSVNFYSQLRVIFQITLLSKTTFGDKWQSFLGPDISTITTPRVFLLKHGRTQENHPLVHHSSSITSFLQCFDTIGWVTEGVWMWPVIIIIKWQNLTCRNMDIGDHYKGSKNMQRFCFVNPAHPTWSNQQRKLHK